MPPRWVVGPDRRQPFVDGVRWFECAKLLVLPEISGQVVELSGVDGTPAVLQAMSGNGDPLRLREVVHVRLLERQNTVRASSS